jgi:glycosyltransferase involved in cell wall biosynthesis
MPIEGAGLTRATVAVCTLNRADVLRGCLASLDNQLFDDDDVEVLVVDNGSTDRTPELLAQWSADSPKTRRSVREPLIGLVNARNAALAASDREVVIFIDDDALATPTWAQAHLSAYLPGAGIGSVGGPIGLVWPSGRPGWITETLHPWFSALDLGDAAGPYPNEHGPYGTNMSVWREAAVALGGFNPRFGRRAGNLMSGEEPEMSHRLVEAGWKLYYEPSAAVVQQVLAERIDRDWLLRRGWAQGVTNARLAVDQTDGSRRTRLRQAKDELKQAARLYRRRDRRPDADLAEMVLVRTHTGAAREFVRSAVAPAARDE